MRRLWTFARRRDGNVAMIVAGGMAMLTGTAVIGVDTASMYLEKRRLQGVADAASLAAAADLTNANARAQAAVALASTNDTRLVTLTPGRFDRDQLRAVDARFVAGASGGNAAQVTVESRLRPFFAQIMGTEQVAIAAQATAARIDLASFSIGSRLASARGGLPGALLSQLAGSELSLSIMDYNALASGQVDLLKAIELLRTGGGVRASTFDDVLTGDITLPQLAIAMAGATTNSSAAATLRTLSTKLPARSVKLGSIVDLGPLAERSSADPQRPIKVDAYAILREALQIGTGTRQVQSDIDLGIPGIGRTRLWWQIGERPAHSRWLTVGQAGSAVVRTAQTRLWMDIALLNVPLNLGSVRVPIYVELAEAEARLVSVACAGGPGTATVGLDITPSLGRTALADLDPAALGDFQQPMALRPARMVVLPLASLTGYADIALGGTRAQRISFTSADIDYDNVKSVSTNDVAAGIATSLLRNIDLRANIVGIGVSAGLLTTTLGNTLMLAAPALDAVIGQVGALAGVRLGEAAVRVDGVRCGTPILVR